MSFHGHIHRNDDLKKAVLMGRVDGKRDWGRERHIIISQKPEKRIFVEGN